MSRATKIGVVVGTIGVLAILLSLTQDCDPRQPRVEGEPIRTVAVTLISRAVTG